MLLLPEATRNGEVSRHIWEMGLSIDGANESRSIYRFAWKGRRCPEQMVA